MEQITRLLCFVFCALVLACKSIHGEKSWRSFNGDNTVTINLSNRQNVQSYANFQTFQRGIYYNTNFIEKQLFNFMEDFFSNVQGFSKIPQNVFPYYFIIPKFGNRNNGYNTVHNNPNLFQTPTVSTTTKTPNKVELLTTNRPMISGNRRFQGEIIPTLRSRTIESRGKTAPPPLPVTKISQTTIANTKSPETATVETQEISTTATQYNEKEQFFDDEDDTTRPIILRDIKSSKNERKLDKKLRKMPEVEHGSMQAGI